MKQGTLLIPLGFLALAGLSAVAILRVWHTHDSNASTAQIVSAYREYVSKAGTAAGVTHRIPNLPPVRFGNGVTILASFNSKIHPSATCVTLNMRSLIRNHIDFSGFKPIDKMLNRHNIPFKNHGNPWKTVVYNQYPFTHGDHGQPPVFTSACLAVP